MEKLKELFSKAQIKYVISVDDCHRVNEQPDDYSIKTNMAKNREETAAFFASIHREDFADIIQDSSPAEIFTVVDSCFQELNEDALRAYVCSCMKDFQVESSAKAALSTLLEALKSSAVIEEFCTFTNREEAQNCFDNIHGRFDVGPDKRVLWMIDKDLSQSGGSSDSGVELIKNFIAVHKPNNIYALTSAQLAGTSNDTFRKSISENLTKNDTLLACVVDKHHITERQYSQLCDQISCGFRQNYSATIIKQLYSIFSNASESANETIEKFGDDTLYKVLFESGRAEGISPIDVFQRLLLIIIREDILKQISDKYDDVAKLVHDYSQLCDWCGILHKDYQDYKVIRDARTSECYDLHVNKRFLPVASGDIFAIGDAHFILIGQSCNLTIRENGERTAQCAMLARISKADESQSGQASKYGLRYLFENEYWSIDFNDCINVDFSVLDLCALNANGKAELLDEYDLSNAKHRYTKAVYNKLNKTVAYNRKLVSEYRELADKYAKKEILFDDLCEAIRLIYKDNSTDVSASFRNGILFNICRKSRISNDILEDILKQYSEYHSRKGLQHDFAKEYRTIPCSVMYDIDWMSYGVDETAVDKILPSQFIFYQSGFSKAEELNRKIQTEFKEYYTEQVLAQDNLKSREQWKWDSKARKFVSTGKDIPVQIGDAVYTDVIRQGKDQLCTYKVPTSILAGLKTKKNITKKMPNGAQLSIGNGYASFSFPKDVPHSFFEDETFEAAISFKMHVAERIRLLISCEGVEKKTSTDSKISGEYN